MKYWILALFIVNGADLHESTYPQVAYLTEAECLQAIESERAHLEEMGNHVLYAHCARVG